MDSVLSHRRRGKQEEYCNWQGKQTVRRMPEVFGTGKGARMGFTLCRGVTVVIMSVEKGEGIR